jgi:uncharacterized protein YcbK (DUF882 family)
VSVYVGNQSSAGYVINQAAALVSGIVNHATRLAMSTLFALAAILGSAITAAAEDRALKLYFTHTGEKATITYKRNGRFDPKGMDKINRLLRDWRRNEPARMDPRLLDLVWEVYDRSGANGHIHIVSAYRSPATNSMLRSRSRSTGVAKNSQHTLGKAMDFFIPGVKLSTVRALAMQMQAGGVGYYPTSGSPFVHLDVGNVRAWPRMSRKELARIFPNGRTMHLAADGSSLPGYTQAVADYKKRVSPASIKIASTARQDTNAKAPAEASRADGERRGPLTALYSAPRSKALDALAVQTTPGGDIEKQPFADLSSYAVPIPSIRPAIMTISTPSPDNIETASIGPISALPAIETPAVLQGSAGFEPFATAQATLKTRMEVIGALPMTGSWKRGANFAAISGKSLMTWALHTPGDVIGMRAPRVSRQTLQVTAGETIPVTNARPFNTGRFGSTPEG